MRIVSLLHSATEIVCSLGLEELLVAVTHECDYPPLVRALPKVTRTRNVVDGSAYVSKERHRTASLGNGPAAE